MEKEELFSKIGLTKYETKTYMTLLKEGSSEVNTIYKEAKIPFGKVYFVLSSLEKKGFVEIINIRPKMYRAINPEIAFQKYHEKEEGWLTKKLNSLKENMSDLLKEFSPVKIQKKKEEILWTTNFDILELEKLNKMLYYYPRKQVDLIPHIINIRGAHTILNEIKKAIKNKVKFRLMLTSKMFKILKRNKDFHKLIKGNKIEIKIVKKIYSYFAVVDGTLAFFLQSNPLDENKLLSAVAIWNKDLAKNLSEEFEKVWEKG